MANFWGSLQCQHNLYQIWPHEVALLDEECKTMHDLNECLQEVESKSAETIQTAQAQRQLFKKGYSFSKLSGQDQVKIWDHVWKEGTTFWVKVQCFFFCETLMRKEAELISLWPVIREWVEEVEGWALSDCLSKIYSRVLEIDPQLIYPALKAG